MRFENNCVKSHGHHIDTRTVSDQKFTWKAQTRLCILIDPNKQKLTCALFEIALRVVSNIILTSSRNMSSIILNINLIIYRFRPA